MPEVDSVETHSEYINQGYPDVLLLGIGGTEIHKSTSSITEYIIV